MKFKTLIFSLLLALGTLSLQAQNEAKMLRFPAIHENQVVFSYAGDLYTVPTDSRFSQDSHLTGKILRLPDSTTVTPKCISCQRKAVCLNVLHTLRHSTAMTCRTVWDLTTS